MATRRKLTKLSDSSGEESDAGDDDEYRDFQLDDEDEDEEIELSVSGEEEEDGEGSGGRGGDEEDEVDFDAELTAKTKTPPKRKFSRLRKATAEEFNEEDEVDVRTSSVG